MSKAFDTIPDLILSPARPNVGVVVKSYNDPYSFKPRKRVFASLIEADNAIDYLDPEGDKVVAVYATSDAPSGWERIQTIQNWDRPTRRTLLDLED